MCCQDHTTKRVKYRVKWRS